MKKLVQKEARLIILVGLLGLSTLTLWLVSVVGDLGY